MSVKKSKDVSCRFKNETTGQMETRKVATATFLEYDSVSEAVENIGEDAALSLINSATMTNAMNAARALAREGPSRRQLEREALTLITAEEWASAAGNPDAIKALVDKYCDKLKAEAQAKVGAGASDDESNA